MRGLLGIAFVGLVLFLAFSWLKVEYPTADGPGWPRFRGPLIDSGLALSGAVLVATVVGVLVDRAAKTRLAEKLAEGWLWGLLGEDAPPQLQQRAKEVLDNRIVLSLDEVRMHCSWASDAEEPEARVLRLRLESLHTGTNYGPTPFRVQPSTRLIPSVPGCQSRVTRWEFEVYPADHSIKSEHLCLDADALAVATESEAVVTMVSAAQLGIPERLQARRGDSYRLLRHAEVFAPGSDAFR